MRPEDKTVDYLLGWNMMKQDHLSSSEVYSHPNTFSSTPSEWIFFVWLNFAGYCRTLLFSSYYLCLFLSSVTDLDIARFLILNFEMWLLHNLLQRSKCFMYFSWFYWNNLNFSHNPPKSKYIVRKSWNSPFNFLILIVLEYFLMEGIVKYVY